MSEGRYVVHVWFPWAAEPDTTGPMFLTEAVAVLANAKVAGLEAEIAVLTPADA